MAVPTKDFVWEQGSDLPIQMIYKTGANAETATPVDLSTGYSLRMDIRKNDYSGELIFTFNSDDITETPSVDQPGDADNEAVLGAGGSININVPRTLTLPGGAVNTALAAGTLVFAYDVFLRNTVDDTQRKFLTGTITVNRSVTLWA